MVWKGYPHRVKIFQYGGRKPEVNKKMLYLKSHLSYLKNSNGYGGFSGMPVHLNQVSKTKNVNQAHKFNMAALDRK